MATPMVVCNLNDIVGNTEVGQQFQDALRKFLAQGDSWFSIGALPPDFTGNILESIVLNASAAAVSCAYPGKTLQQMVKWDIETPFASLLYGPQAWPWEAVLLSAGGNDLIDAVNTLPDEADADKASRRLLRTTVERINVPTSLDCSHYVRPEGWAAFTDTLLACFAALVQKRDGAGSECNGVPILVHNYDYAQPRNAPATVGLPNIGLGPWLYSAFTAAPYQIPQADWLTLVKYLLNSWADFITGTPASPDVNTRLAGTFGLASGNICLVRLAGTLTPADVNNIGPDVDWVNEIHPTLAGYRKLGALYSAQMPAAPITLAVADVPAGNTKS
ncbi:hypothetical protein [Paraburkholderia sp. J76]|uniref:hypothetical protein n=1 Tax=Paraburkholderia sp. J76 TaxID=2805439 RepID=UPI002ABD434C|nr:hypothetical protein [Paraburkholderia sp. J76]